MAASFGSRNARNRRVMLQFHRRNLRPQLQRIILRPFQFHLGSSELGFVLGRLIRLKR